MNAPQLARDDGGDGRITPFVEAADKVVALDLVKRTVTYRETDGFQGGEPVRYVSTDASPTSRPPWRTSRWRPR